jgi:adenylosuccinate synthase
MRNIDVVVDLQFGSCGKGLLAGWLAMRKPYDTIITAWAPNAGHTYIDRDGNVYVLRALPNGVVSNSVKRIMIGPGSVIDPDLFKEELFMLTKANLLRDKEIYIHPHACVVLPEHKEQEKSMVKIGSTMKGVGAAMIQKIRRDPDNLNTVAHYLLNDRVFQAYTVSTHRWNMMLEEEVEYALIEGAQGFSLSINHGFYPYTTSRDCTVAQLLVDCGIPYGVSKNCHIHSIGVARTYPIRVANRYDENKKQIGWSGPCYWDQRELDWSDIGVAPELTTVTKLPRRVFTWSKYQIQNAIRQNGVQSVFINFCNYVKDPSYVGEMESHIHEVGARIGWWGFGPTDRDVLTLRSDVVAWYARKEAA